jgi:hypothetical protein
LKRDKAREAAGSGIITIDVFGPLALPAATAGSTIIGGLILGFRWRSTPGFMLSAAPQAGLDEKKRAAYVARF